MTFYLSLIFKVTPASVTLLKFSNFDEKSLCAPCLLNQMANSGQIPYNVGMV